MKVRHITIAVAALAIALVGAGCNLDGTNGNNVVGLDALSAWVVDNVNGQQTACVTLYAGQYINVGTVCYEVVGDNLLVTYSTTGGWELTEAHFWSGCALDGYPSTPKGNPKIGNFPYNAGDITGATTYSFSVDLTDPAFAACLGTIDCEYGNLMYAMAHASVRKDNGDGTYQTETGWGDGPRVVDRGSWATRSTLTLKDDSCGGTGGDDCYCGETGFAFGGKAATCFIGADFDGNGVDDGFNRWGWSNAISADFGQLSYAIYTGAGQCDLSKGTHVGTLDVVDNGDGTLSVTYNAFAGYTFAEFHLYVGCEPLARNNGEYTVAPGQYPVVEEVGLPGLTTQTYTVDKPACESFYLVAHTVEPTPVECVFDADGKLLGCKDNE